MPFFFLSYADADGDGYMDQFYADLCTEVRARTGLRADDIGFRDRTNIGLGSDWPSDLAEALISTRVFVAACSPSYFASEMCGKEWQFFAHRAGLRERASGGAHPPATLIPITWIPTGTLPDVASRLQHTHEDLGLVYRREGLHFLARLRRFQDDYHTFVIRLAERIVASGDRPPPRPESIPDLQSVPSAFTAPGRSPAPRPAGRNATRRPSARPAVTEPGAHVPAAGGPKHVNFVVAAAPAHKLATIRRDLQCYGLSFRDWAPYRPAADKRICVFAQRIASRKDLTSALETAERSILDILSGARERNEIVVLLVDVWTTTLDPYHEILVEYDERNAPTSAVMVPWNTADPETMEKADELREALRAAFPNNAARRDTVFKPEVTSIEDFESALEEVLAEAQARIFSFGTVARRAGGERVIERPILSQPGEAGAL